MLLKILVLFLDISTSSWWGSRNVTSKLLWHTSPAFASSHAAVGIYRWIDTHTHIIYIKFHPVSWNVTRVVWITSPSAPFAICIAHKITSFMAKVLPSLVLPVVFLRDGLLHLLEPYCRPRFSLVRFSRTDLSLPSSEADLCPSSKANPSLTFSESAFWPLPVPLLHGGWATQAASVLLPYTLLASWALTRSQGLLEADLSHSRPCRQPGAGTEPPAVAPPVPPVHLPAKGGCQEGPDPRWHGGASARLLEKGLASLPFPVAGASAPAPDGTHWNANDSSNWREINRAAREPGGGEWSA